MPVWQNERPEQNYADNDGRGDCYRPPRHSSLKYGLGSAGRPGKRQDRLEGAKGQEEQNEDVAIAQLEVHPPSALNPRCKSHSAVQSTEGRSCGLRASRCTISTSWACALLAGSRNSS